MKLRDGATVILVLLLLAGVFVVGATVTGQGKELCDAMGGVYTPENNVKGLDVCPGGSRGKFFSPQPSPQ